MSAAGRFAGRHPLCDCPDRREFPYGVDIRPDVCAGGSVAHPVLTGLDIEQISAALRASSASSGASDSR